MCVGVCEACVYIDVDVVISTLEALSIGCIITLITSTSSLPSTWKRGVCFIFFWSSWEHFMLKWDYQKLFTQLERRLQLADTHFRTICCGVCVYTSCVDFSIPFRRLSLTGDFNTSVETEREKENQHERDPRLVGLWLT